ncbi:dicarboxylate/amino acid:cation symporter [Algoriphagus sp.]|jgi:proton glutamate symport protein|uniref:dicarboxylate/amino acid:cation symporter n=1 Tax=Algoriphagus sp. TaxID=1872435 RepID=UPI0027168D64|nr:cation:dicarboxylase symporter family transporter [Algoriphagus sp.]MDO8966724.1 cation:dicarboxylase symporter family transporter [Algoriphagus sp.]MDP3199953.1 cation:dicarboxylase symporter family transporter [Algoriphagus sp.]
MSLHKSSGVLILLALLATQAAIFIVINLLFPGTIGDSLMLTSRLLGLVAVVGYCLKRASLTTWIFGSMLIGTAIGTDFPEVAMNLKVVSQLFLKLIKTVIAPLLFGTLVVGIAGHSNLKQVGRMGWKSLLYFEIVTTLALLIGLLAINISQAGVGIELPVGEVLLQGTARTWQEVILHIFPENIAKSVVEGEILQIVIFSILFGIGLALVKDGKKKQVMLSFTESLSEVMFNFTRIIMYFAPFGVGAAIAYTVGEMGLGILVNLFHLLATLYVALLAFLVLVLLPIALMLKIPVIKFLKAISEPVSIAFATTSSEAALPKAMEAMEKFGVPRKIVAFVMPTGYSFNLDGTTLYLALASIFVAQAAGIKMSIEDQLLMVLTLMLTSKGVAGIPRASLIILMGTAASFNLPMAPIFLILAIDELMDMARTSVNVIGNCLATCVIAKWEGEFGLPPEENLELIEAEAVAVHELPNSVKN